MAVEENLDEPRPSLGGLTLRELREMRRFLEELNAACGWSVEKKPVRK